MIRKATIDDAELVADLYIGCRKKHIPFARPAHTEDEIRSWIREHLIPKQNVLVLERSDEIKAMMATSTSETESWIDQLYVEAGNVGKGYGSALLNLALSELKKPIKLYTFQENKGARRFYERNGFRAVQFSDGSENEEKCPDVLYALENNEPNQTVQTTRASARV